MNSEFLKAYQDTLNKESVESDLTNSTELHESIGKWFGNLFKNKENAINETLTNVLGKYHFEPFIDGNNDIVGKKQNGVYIVLYIMFAENKKAANILVTLYSEKSLKELGNGQLIEMKHSWEDDELAEALQRALNPFRIKLNTRWRKN